jgi:uncharacterized membrane protein YkvA (DUF1232 family)
MRITIELEPEDVESFRKTLARSRQIALTADESDVLHAAKHSLNTLLIGNAPEYVRKRMVGVQRLILMIEDDAWKLPNPEREAVLETLVYFSDPEDLIPDHIEVIGLLDDAIVIELLLRRQRHVLQAYGDFCAYRETLGAFPNVTAECDVLLERLVRRRAALHTRMRRRMVRECQQERAAKLLAQ